MRYEMSENAMEKLVQDVADIKAGQAFYKESLQRIENKLEETMDEHASRIRALETYKDKQLGLMSLAALLGGIVTWSFDHLKAIFK
jgi:uncharacterized protein (UPF0305 family)